MFSFRLNFKNIYICICKNIINNFCKLFEFRVWIFGGRDYDFGIFYIGLFIFIINMVYYICSERIKKLYIMGVCFIIV